MFWGIYKYVEDLEGLPVPNREKKISEGKIAKCVIGYNV